MLTGMTDEDWSITLEVFDAARSGRGQPGRNDRGFLEALHYFTVHNVTRRALPPEFGNWNSVWKRFWRLSRAGVFEVFFQLLAETRRETDWSSVDYHHVELNEHAILVAEGLPADSYLDTGNRGFFASSDQATVLHPDLTDESDYPPREVGSCAPFVWDEVSVRPVWQRLVDRAATISPVGSPQRVTTTDADLRLLADQRTVKAVVSDNERVMFMLPPGASEVRLVSRAQSPTEARPWLSDPRRLGVRVKHIVLRDGDEMREIPMDHPDVTRGWWDIERDGPMMSRWTDGEAVLPLPPMGGPAMLEMHLAGTMIYLEDVVPDEVVERRAA